MIESERRDRAADQAYRDHANDVYRVAYGILRDPDEALDATHDTFARAWERWDQYDSQRPLRGWLHGIVVHVALDLLRRRRVRRLALPHLGSSPTAPRALPGGGDPADQLAQEEVVEDALDGLRPPVRAALVLRHVYGYDYAQIGSMLGMSSGNVGSTLTRAHAAIRARLEARNSARPEMGFVAPRHRRIPCAAARPIERTTRGAPMTHDQRPPAGPDSFDDEAIGRLVRETAAGWAMPPVRLDAPSWRDRIRSPRARRIAGARGWFGRFGQAATAAVALTVVGALVAVVLTGPTNRPGTTPAPSGSANSGATAAPEASPLPKLVLNGELPSVTDVLVVDEFGSFDRVDLTTGAFKQGVSGGGPGSALRTPAGRLRRMPVRVQPGELRRHSRRHDGPSRSVRSRRRAPLDDADRDVHGRAGCARRRQVHPGSAGERAHRHELQRERPLRVRRVELPGGLGMAQRHSRRRPARRDRCQPARSSRTPPPASTRPVGLSRRRRSSVRRVPAH